MKNSLVLSAYIHIAPGNLDFVLFVLLNAAFSLVLRHVSFLFERGEGEGHACTVVCGSRSMSLLD